MRARRLPTPPWNLSFDSETAGGRILIRVDGESDAFTSMQLREFLRRHLEAGHVDLLLDLSGLTFIDSAGLRVLVDTDSALRRSGGSLVLSSPSRPVLRILDIAGLRDQFQISTP